MGYSRIKSLKVTSNRNQRALFCCIIDAFHYFGRIPRQILFDNMKTIIDRSKTNFSNGKFSTTFKNTFQKIPNLNLLLAAHIAAKQREC